LRGLIERGLRRVMMVVHDDFSGLLPITKSLFPQADVQLCVVHMQRNAKNHLSKTDAAEFQQRWRALKSTWDQQVGITQFEELCQRFEKGYPTFMAELSADSRGTTCDRNRTAHRGFDPHTCRRIPSSALQPPNDLLHRSTTVEAWAGLDSLGVPVSTWLRPWPR